MMLYGDPFLTNRLTIEDTEKSNTTCRFNEEFKYILLPVSYTIVFVLGLALNSVALWMFLTKMRPWNASTVYMFHLALSDMLYVLSLPTLIYYYANRNNWPFGVALCKIVRFMFYANLYCSILLLTCISVHRYLGVCHPIRSLRLANPRNAHLVCGLGWAAVSVCLVPNLIFVNTSPRGNDTLCHDTSKPEDFEHFVTYSSVVMSLLFGVPFFIIVVCYCLMARTLCRPRLNRDSQKSKKSRKKSITLIIMVLLVFAICFVPFHITRTLYYKYRIFDAECWVLNIINFSYKVTRPLASMNSCLDPILYFLAGDLYRSRLCGVFNKKKADEHLHPLPGKKDNLELVYKNPVHQEGSGS